VDFFLNNVLKWASECVKCDCVIGKRKSLIQQMNSVGCILVTSYVGAVQHQEALLARDWHYVILDEGHKIRNPDTQVGSMEMKLFDHYMCLVFS
jgi:DNA excision repair protein ERCC-6